MKKDTGKPEDEVKKMVKIISSLSCDIDTLLEERDRIPVDGAGADDVMKKYKNQNLIEGKLNQLHQEIQHFETTITSSKKKKEKDKLDYNIKAMEDQKIQFGVRYDEFRVNTQN